MHTFLQLRLELLHFEVDGSVECCICCQLVQIGDLFFELVQIGDLLFELVCTGCVVLTSHTTSLPHTELVLRERGGGVLVCCMH